ncbi:HpcH/HpaI aldolase/citrate lyase family protein [Herbaspirillum autotrophicum]|uniref:HpcH/HpaI aldolase/citrate lyase family protein n=1 Tax=Herbaspirillum autotrophicum TaxID=180195 RepID=UPI000A8B0C01|nr:aldolase/citrate lyase family protein [Herbaspirillum autotrophicum]
MTLCAMPSTASTRRPPTLRRGWMFVAGMDQAAHARAIAGGADVVVADLEEFTAPADRPEARLHIAAMMADCRARGVVGAVRVNKLEHDGHADLCGVMAGRPDVVFLPHVDRPEQIVALAAEISSLEAEQGIAAGSTEIAPTIESAAGLLALGAILRASPRVTACLLAAEDFSASLGAERGADGVELRYARARFLLECVAAGVVAIDCPCTFRAIATFTADLELARRLGFKSKCVVFPEHVALLNEALTPSAQQVQAAEQLCSAFERQKTAPPTDLSLWIDAPLYNNGRRLLARHAEFVAWHATAV